MAMKLEISFPKPVDRETKTRVLIAIGCLAKSERIVFTEGGRRAVVRGEAMGVDRVRNALEEHEVAFEAIHTSLHAELDQQADETMAEAGSRTERFRPIGR